MGMLDDGVDTVFKRDCQTAPDASNADCCIVNGTPHKRNQTTIKPKP